MRSQVESKQQYWYPAWQKSDDGGWVFQRRELVCTASYDGDSRSYAGLESAQRMTALFLSNQRKGTLEFLASLPIDGEFSEKAPASPWQLTQRALKQFALRLLPGGNTESLVVQAALGCFGLVAGACWSKRENASLRFVGLVASALASALAVGLQIYQVYQVWPGQSHEAEGGGQSVLKSIDLQTAELPPNE